LKTIIAIDPGSRVCAVAIIQGPDAWTMVVRDQKVVDIEALVTWLVVTFGGPSGKDVEFWIEDQYLAEHGAGGGQRGKVNWPSIVKLVAARVRWQTLIEVKELPCRLANTAKWQAKMHAATPRLAANGKKLNRKTRSKIAVASIWRDVPRVDCPTEVKSGKAKPRDSSKVIADEADALCIGRYAQLYGGE
jgi:hypothetical protein